MTEFRTCALVALEQLPVRDYAAAHSRAQREHDHGIIFLAGSAHIFAERRRVGVVGDEYGHAQRAFEIRYYRHIFPGEVVRVHHFAVTSVYRAGAPHAYAAHGDVRFLYNGFGELRYVRKDCFRAGAVTRGTAAGSDYPAVPVHHAALDARAADVYAEVVRNFAFAREYRCSFAIDFVFLAAGHEKAVACRKFFAVYFAAARNKTYRDERVVVRFNKSPVEFQLAHAEVLAFGKPANRAARYFLGLAAVGFVAERLEVDYLDRLFDVKRTELSVEKAAVVVVHAIGDVAALLHLADEAALADCVHRAGFYQVTVALFDGDKVKKLLHRAVLDLFEKFLAVHVALEAAVNPCPRSCRDDIPGFGLAVVALVFFRILVARVNLHRQVFRRVNVLDKHGKLAAVFVHRARGFFKILGKSLVRACNSALAVAVYARFPALGDDSVALAPEKHL